MLLVRSTEAFWYSPGCSWRRHTGGGEGGCEGGWEVGGWRGL